jgi:DegV family protein with EDD domain
MVRVLLTTDSSACLPLRVFDRQHVRVLPISIHLPTGDWPDGPETAHRTYAAIAAGETVHSRPPSAFDYLKAVEDGDFEAALVITPAAEFTAMHHNASVAAKLSSRPVEIIDSRTAAAGQSLIVLAVLAAIERGASLTEAVQVARQAVQRARLVAVLPTMTALEENARLPASAIGRTRSGVPSLFRFQDGTVTHIGDVRPTVNPVEALSQVRNHSGGSEAAPTLVFHAAQEHLARTLAHRIPGKPRVVPFSPAMAIHTGPGWLGIAWLD